MRVKYFRRTTILIALNMKENKYLFKVASFCKNWIRKFILDFTFPGWKKKYELFSMWVCVYVWIQQRWMQSREFCIKASYVWRMWCFIYTRGVAGNVRISHVKNFYREWENFPVHYIIFQFKIFENPSHCKIKGSMNKKAFGNKLKFRNWKYFLFSFSAMKINANNEFKQLF